jgi:hypothetical protein
MAPNRISSRWARKFDGDDAGRVIRGGASGLAGLAQANGHADDGEYCERDAANGTEAVHALLS